MAMLSVNSVISQCSWPGFGFPNPINDLIYGKHPFVSIKKKFYKKILCSLKFIIIKKNKFKKKLNLNF